MFTTRYEAGYMPDVTNFKTIYFWDRCGCKFSTQTLRPAVMRIITLTTDWGSGDPYASSFTGDILRHGPGVRIEHLTHQLPKGDLLSAAFFTISTFHHFPKGTIHYLGLESGGGNQYNRPAKHLIARFQDHFFVGADNGIFGMIFQDRPYECWKPDFAPDLHFRELFNQLASVLAALAADADPASLGAAFNELEENRFTRPSIDPSGIRCSVIYVDSNGNAIFNLTRGLFEKERNGRRFTMLVRKASYRINKISTRYNDVVEGDILALFNQNDFLVIAMNRDNASKLIGFRVYDSILIEFHDNQDR